jgi:hypothetical protein
MGPIFNKKQAMPLDTRLGACYIIGIFGGKMNFKLKEHKDFAIDILANSRGSCGAAMCFMLTEEKNNFIDRSDFISKALKRNIGFCRRSVQRVLSNLIIDGTILEKNPDPRAKSSRREKEIATSGIYGIFLDNSVYVGLSKNIDERWIKHRIQISNKTHSYFHCESNELEFKVLHRCEEDRLHKCELLMAQKLKTEGFNVLNENNFNLI